MSEQAMTEEELAAIEARADAATAGPWYFGRWAYYNTPRGELTTDHDFVLGGSDDQDEAVRVCRMGPNGWHDEQETERADAEFIIAARTAVPALVAEVRRLRRELEWAEEGIFELERRD